MCWYQVLRKSFWLKTYEGGLEMILLACPLFYLKSRLLKLAVLINHSALMKD
jgi:hypothetical protein